MDRVFFEERQTLSGVVIGLVVLSGVALCFPFARGLYVRMILHQPWGDASLTNERLVWIMGGLLLVAAVVIWLVAVQYQDIKIDQAGIHYKMFPQQRRERVVDRGSITGYTIRKLKWYEFLQSPRKRRKTRMGEQDLYVLRGNMVLELTLSGGRRLILGTRNPDGVTWAMKKLMSNP